MFHETITYCVDVIVMGVVMCTAIISFFTAVAIVNR